MKKIILLDLNATFVSNTNEAHNLPYTYNVEKEFYRSWLTEMIRPYYVILMTSRPQHHMRETMERIKKLENWEPNEAYFNQWRKPAEQAKLIMMDSYVIPNHGKHGKNVFYFALESNFKTQDMFKTRFGIYSNRQQDVKRTGRLEPVIPKSLFG